MSVSPYSGSALKRSALHFLSGKTISALLTFVTLLWLVRLLTIEEYAAYMILISIRELVPAVTTLGIPWIVARYLPEFRIHASGQLLIHFVRQVLIRIVLCLVGGILLFFIVLPWLLSQLELTEYIGVVKLYLLVTLLEGLGQSIRHNILGALLQQGQAQISLVARNLTFLLLLAVIAFQGAVTIHHVVLAELAASGLGVVLALRGLIRHLNRHHDKHGSNDWQPPVWSKMWRVARHMYYSHLITLSYSPHIFVFLVQRYLGVEATALFGFLRSFVGQISRYLPATLLFSLIQPKLVSSYVGTGGMTELKHNANLAGKLSLFVLMPLLVFSGLAGEELLSLLSGEKFNQSGYYFAVFLLMLIPLSQHRILETVAVVSDNSHLNSWGSSLGLLALPLAYGLLETGQGLWAPIVAMIASQMIFNTTLIVTLTRTTTYRPDTAGFFKLIVSALIIFFLLQLLALPVYDWPDLIIIAVLTGISFLLTTFFIKPFRLEERTRLNRLFNRRIFI